jgi:hypothetical protein
MFLTTAFTTLDPRKLLAYGCTSWGILEDTDRVCRIPLVDSHEQGNV